MPDTVVSWDKIQIFMLWSLRVCVGTEYCRMGQAEERLKLYLESKGNGSKPNAKTLTGASLISEGFIT